MNLETIRSWQFTKMELSIRAMTSLLSQADPAELTAYRDDGSGWTALEVLGHLRDFEVVFYERGRLTVEQDTPDLPFPNPDALAVERSYNTRDWRELLDEWQQERMKNLSFLRTRAETDWERPAQHPVRGILTLHDQLFLTGLHDTLHIEQFTRILAEKKTGPS